MCGIVGIVSNKSVSASIISALKKLEYRGYDSAGISTLSKGQINEQKCSGRVDNLEKILFQKPSNGHLGIGHVRYPTSGLITKNEIQPFYVTDFDGNNKYVENKSIIATNAKIGDQMREVLKK